MRMVAAVLAAVLSVATGGPLRCPCQLAQLVCGTERVAEARADAEHLGCPCRTHRDSESSQPSEYGRVPVKPCDHGPSIDFVASVAGERSLGNDVSYGDPALDVHARTVPIDRSFGPFLPVPPVSVAVSDRLKYCHSFLC